MQFSGRARCFGDNINTDYILPGKYKFQSFQLDQLLPHLFEDIDPQHYQKVKQGDILVAGRNFGCGSSREVAPALLKYAGYQAVVAPSFGRIFFRNAITIGLPILHCETAEISDGDILAVNLTLGQVKNISKNCMLQSAPLPAVMLDILQAGGLISLLKQQNLI